MVNTKKVISEVVKTATDASVSTIIGGLIGTFLIPYGIVFKGACFVGAVMTSWFAMDKMDTFIDKKIDEAEDIINEIKSTISEAKENA